MIGIRTQRRKFVSQSRGTNEINENLARSILCKLSKR
jgi:hypothetical protein